MRLAAVLLALLPSPRPPRRRPDTDQIVISQPAEATTMDPGRSTQVLTVNYFINLYDTLTRWDGALKLQPGLATSWKQVNDTTWDFTLREGVKFHDGTPRTSRPRWTVTCPGRRS
jgi:ABC-type transport system substrate-binding protein